MSGSSLRGDDRILTTHVGSLVRPDELVAALRVRRSGGDVGDEEFDAILARSVREVVSRQADVGIDVVSDGEFGKTISWSRYILERLRGFEDRPDLTAGPSGPQRPLGPRTDIERFPDFYREYDKTQSFEDVMRNPGVRRTDLLRRSGRY
jgi:5-methyltetrahydropteroyltriglutamate--homocysteine methyltransferase